MFNLLTKKNYQGNNETVLVETKELHAFTSDGWCTFVQAKEIGKKVKKGSKCVARIFCGIREVEAKVGDSVITTKKPMGFKCVFNEDQLESIK